MSKKLSYRGQLPMGEQNRIRLKTIKGKVGYKIVDFSIMCKTPGISSVSYVAKITSTDQTGSINATIDFTDSDLLAASFSNFASGASSSSVETVIFDNSIINQDIFINITDPDGGTIPANYYIELETMSLSDIETTMLTLQNIRQITAPAGNV